MENPGSAFESQTFPGHYYEVVRELGRGGMGTVYLVLLRETATNRSVRPYAAKVIYEQYLQEENSRQRRQNLQQEIDILKQVDPGTSVTLIELLQDESRHILIQEYVNGGTLNNVIAARETPLKENEIQCILAKIADGLNELYKRNIIHRDININNIMLHFPDNLPRGVELESPDYLRIQETQVIRRIQDLSDGSYEVKLIDYGLACELDHGQFKTTKCGTLDLAAPEVLNSKYDHRVDVWGVGLIAYMLYHSEYMFQDYE